MFLAKNIKAMSPEPDPDVFTPKELAAINISKKLGPVPSQVTSLFLKLTLEVGSSHRFRWVCTLFPVDRFL